MKNLTTHILTIVAVLALAAMVTLAPARTVAAQCAVAQLAVTPQVVSPGNSTAISISVTNCFQGVKNPEIIVTVTPPCGAPQTVFAAKVTLAQGQTFPNDQPLQVAYAVPTDACTGVYGVSLVVNHLGSRTQSLANSFTVQ